MTSAAQPVDPTTAGSSRRIAELIAVRTTEYVAQVDNLHAPPALGSVAVIRDAGMDILSFVTSAETVPNESGRRPTARGADYDTAEEFYARRPEINRLIHTEFTAVIIAHRIDGQLMPYVPPRPPRLHAFVYAGEEDDIACLANDPLTLQSIASARTESPLDFVPAAIRTLASIAGGAQAQEEYLRDTGRRLVYIMRDDMRGLQTVLAKIRPNVSGSGNRA